MLIKYIFACIRVKNKFFCKILSTLVRIFKVDLKIHLKIYFFLSKNKLTLRYWLKMLIIKSKHTYECESKVRVFFSRLKFAVEKVTQLEDEKKKSHLKG